MNPTIAHSSQTSRAELAARLQPSTPDAPIWIRVGKLLDGESRSALEDVHVVYDAHRIRYVGPAAEPPSIDDLRAGQTTPDAELPSYTLLPGLIEAHAHLFLDGAPLDFEIRRDYLKQPGDWLLERGRQRWPKMLECGVMTVRDAGDKDGVGLALSAEYRSKQTDGLSATPYIDSPGAAIHHAGRYGKFMGQPLEDYGSLEACVAGRVAAGASRIKLLATGIINFKAGAVTAPPQMSVEEVSQLVAASKAQGKQTFAHASGTEGVGNSIRGGVTSVEHGYFVTREQLAEMRDLGTAWVPTFAPVQRQIDDAEAFDWDANIVGNLQRIIDAHSEMLRHGDEMGVRILAGSDAGSCGVPHGVGLITEMQLMQRAGMSPTAVINSATGRSAEVLGFDEPIGRIASGCRARMILAAVDPTDDVGNLQCKRVVLFDGQVSAHEGPTDTEGL